MAITIQEILSQEEQQAFLQAQRNSASSLGASAPTAKDVPASAATSALMLAILATINFLQQTNQTMASTSEVAGDLANIKTTISTQMQSDLDKQMGIITQDVNSGASSQQITADTTKYQNISQTYQSVLTNIDAPTQETSGTVEQGANGEKTDEDLAQTILQANAKDLLRS